MCFSFAPVKAFGLEIVAFLHPTTVYFHPVMSVSPAAIHNKVSPMNDALMKSTFNKVIIDVFVSKMAMATI